MKKIIREITIQEIENENGHQLHIHFDGDVSIGQLVTFVLME